MSYTNPSYCLTLALQGLTLIYRIHHNKKEGGLQEAEGLLDLVDDVALLHHHEQLPLDQHHQEDEVQRHVQHHLVQNEEKYR